MTSSQPRRGTAPLEFVLALPLLLALAAVLLWVGKSAITRAEVDGETRAAVWEQRSEAMPGEPLHMDHALTTGRVEATSESRVPGREILGENLARMSGVGATHFREWTFEDLPFPDLKDHPIQIHRELLIQLVERNPRTLGHMRPHLQRLGGIRTLVPESRP